MSFLRDLFGAGDSKNAYDHVYEGKGSYGPDNQYNGNDQQQTQHKASLTHEVIGGAAGFAG
jgi:hypothetical protein